MLELTARGLSPDHRWRRQIPPIEPFLLGRATSAFKVPWDNKVSRSHVRLRVVDGRLLVQRLAEAANPVFFNGNQEESFALNPGEHFVIGNTTFTLAKDAAHATLDAPNPIRQKTFSHEFLQQVHYRDADHRIDVLSRLPEVISSANNEQELLGRLVNTLLAGISLASAIAIVRNAPPQTNANGVTRKGEATNETEPSNPVTQIIHWDRRGSAAGDFQPSEKLIRQALESSETVLHIWHPTKTEKPEFTFDFENDWAFVCPINSVATPGWGIYVTGTNSSGSNPAMGSGSDENDLQGDVKFCELVGSTLKNLLLVRQLERRQASLRSFFSPIVLDALQGRDPEEVLAPQECQVSVLFCDLRGFAKTSESMADELLKLLNRVSRSLDIMTAEILQHGGVIGDFQGDSAMGFWGWPLTQNDTATRAIKTALNIKAEFDARRTDPPDFEIGIGVATGMAVAGQIGTRDQVKVTVFGPVVNLASRLEGMTRLLDASILVDKATANQISEQQSDANFIARRRGRFQPFGMTSAIDLVELLAPSDSNLDKVAAFEESLDRFQAGNWKQATQLLEQLDEDDSAAKFLHKYIQNNGMTCPVDWNGVIEMKSK